VFELVHLGPPVRPLDKARKKKSKTVKKSLNPVFGESGQVEWDKVDEDVSALGLKVDLWDADAFSSDPLGGCLIPLAHVMAAGGGGQGGGQGGAGAATPQRVEAWYPLQSIATLKPGQASGEVRVALTVTPSAVLAEAIAAVSAANPLMGGSKPGTPRTVGGGSKPGTPSSSASGSKPGTPAAAFHQKKKTLPFPAVSDSSSDDDDDDDDDSDSDDGDQRAQDLKKAHLAGAWVKILDFLHEDGKVQ
jgi:hypothetical protein